MEAYPEGGTAEPDQHGNPLGLSWLTLMYDTRRVVSPRSNMACGRCRRSAGTARGSFEPQLYLGAHAHSEDEEYGDMGCLCFHAAMALYRRRDVSLSKPNNSNGPTKGIPYRPLRPQENIHRAQTPLTASHTLNLRPSAVTLPSKHACGTAEQS
jgi:hypothetical protein